MKSWGKSSMGRNSRAVMAKASSLSRLIAARCRSLGGFQALILTLLQKNAVETCREQVISLRQAWAPLHRPPHSSEEPTHSHIHSSHRAGKPRNKTLVSTITGRFFTIWATKEAQKTPSLPEFYSNLYRHKSIMLPLWEPEQASHKYQGGRSPTTYLFISIHCFALFWWAGKWVPPAWRLTLIILMETYRHFLRALKLLNRSNSTFINSHS